MTVEIVFFAFLASIVFLLWRLTRAVDATQDRLLNFINGRLSSLEAGLYHRQQQDYDKLREEIRQQAALIRTWSEPETPSPKEAANDHA